MTQATATDDGITKMQLSLKTGISRPAVDRHLIEFLKGKQVKQDGTRLIWILTYKQLKQLEHYRVTEEVMRIEEEAEKFFRVQEVIAEDTLEGDALRKRLNEIRLGELSRRAYIFREMLKVHGSKSIEKKLAYVTELIQLLQQIEETPSVDKQLEMLRSFKVKCDKIRRLECTR